MDNVETKFNQWFEKEVHTPMKAHANYGSEYVDNHLEAIKVLAEAAFNAGYNTKKQE